MSSILIPVAVIGGLILVMGLLSLFEGRGGRDAAVAACERRPAGAISRAERCSGSPRTSTSSSARCGWASPWPRPWPESSPACLIWRMLDDRAANHIGCIPGRDGRGAAIGIMLAIVFFGELPPAEDRPALAREMPACRLARPAGAGTCSWPVPSPGSWAGRPISWPGCSASGRQLVPPITHEEIKGLVWEGARAGVFDEAEHEIFKRVFRFCDRRARALMTPRDQVVWIDVADSPEEIRRKVLGLTALAIPRLRREPGQPAGNRPGQGLAGARTPGGQRSGSRGI